jgi:hypothetical protein
VADTRHILIDVTASKVNNNNFYGTSLESPNTVEYHLDCGGNDNYWWGCRWENTGTGARVLWANTTIGNVIAYGFASHTIVETTASGWSSNTLLTRARSRMVGDGAALGYAVLALENSASSTAASLRVMEAGAEVAGTDQTTAWAVELSAQKLRGKRAGDAYERVLIDTVNGRIYFGAGTAATARYFGNVGSSLGFDGASVGFITDNTYDFGIASLRPRDLNLGRNANIGGNAVITGTSKVSGFTTSYGTAAPTTGAHVVGDEHKNSVPAVGQPKSWLCTVAGTPGTWVSTGDL